MTSIPSTRGHALALLSAATALLAVVAGDAVRQPIGGAWVWALLVATAAATARRVVSSALTGERSAAVFLAALGLVWGAIAAGTVTLLGCAGWLGVPSALVVTGALHALAVHRLPPPRPWQVVLDGLPFGRGVTVPGALLCFALLIVCAFVAYNQVLYTPQDADSMWYHLPMSGEWVRTGSLQPVAAIPLIGSAYPGFRQALVAFLSLPSGNEHLALLAVLELPLLALAVYALGRAWGACRAVALAVAFHAVTTPVVLGAYTTQGNDVSLAIHLLLALLFLRRFLAAGAAGEGLLAGLALGALAAIKFSGLGYAGLVVLVACLELGVRQLRPGRGSLLVLLAAVVMAAPWYLRNLLVFGNPLYPARLQLGGQVVFDGPLTKEYFAPTTLGFDVGPLFANAQHFVDAHGWLIVVLGPSPVLAIVAASRRQLPWRLGAAAAVLPALLFVAFLHHPFNRPWFDAGYTHRYLIVWFAASSAVAAAALSRLGPAWLWVVPCLVPGFLAIGAVTHWMAAMAAMVVLATGVVMVPALRRSFGRAADGVLAARVPAVVAVLGVAALAFGLQHFRTRQQYDERTGWHDAVSDRGWGPCVAWVHRNVQNARIGLHGSIYFFPLLGEPFGNEVFVADDLHLDVPRRTAQQVADWAREQRLHFVVCCVPRQRTASREFVFGESMAKELLAGWPQRFSVAFESRGAAVLKVSPEGG